MSVSLLNVLLPATEYYTKERRWPEEQCWPEATSEPYPTMEHRDNLWSTSSEASCTHSDLFISFFSLRLGIS